jgi:surface protein, putative
MKRVKRVLALLAALALVLAMAVPAFADEVKYTITINNSVGTYEAYQIFKGDLAGNVLSNIEWGTGVTEAGKAAFGRVTAAEVAKTLDNETAAKAFATKISGYLDTTAAVEGTDKITGLSAGYYLIKNKSVNESEAYTDFILQVVNNVKITPKGQKPTLEKQIKHNDGEWGVVGDNQIGDTVEFRTITTVPITTGYTEYDYTIFDEMSTGLTSDVKDASGITIKINDEEKLDSSYYTVTVNANKFSVKVDILKAISEGKIEEGNKLYTYYTGVLNEDANVYGKGNQQNTAYLQYSNNPHDTTKGETPHVTVYDWTFKMNVQKIDGADKEKELKDAKFVLSKNGAVDLGTIDENGTPTKTENLIKLVYDSENSTYRVATASDKNITYVMTAGNITIKGLDDAVDYYLYETKAPAGYNRLTEPVKFKINATYDETGDSCTAVSTKVGDKAAVTGLKVSVENNAGTTLPSTGGMGTTVFYVVGGGLMAVAVVLLVTKKRMENKR